MLGDRVGDPCHLFAPTVPILAITANGDQFRGDCVLERQPALHKLAHRNTRRAFVTTVATSFAAFVTDPRSNDLDRESAGQVGGVDRYVQPVVMASQSLENVPNLFEVRA